MAAGMERVDHQDVSTCIVAILLVWWYHCLQVLSVLVVLRIAVLMVDGAG